ncbi:unnamed protein product [Didymodactylos carnosus]|uniref:3'-5' exonuclease domain-containing protein n=1 Tax=Didymodactylos carnosus TaxID=1234261 RepID=A0A815TQD7_9BILA|nr:unnamed protein product [Didymodactylos carnosus]CAF4368308.1 unnamed protein product [Didymodactylos carnosus]
MMEGNARYERLRRKSQAETQRRRQAGKSDVKKLGDRPSAGDAGVPPANSDDEYDKYDIFGYPPKTLDETTYFYVDTVDKLNNMMDHHVKEQQELAVGCERHSYRSYQVFTCLLQISTRSNDYLVDALVLREELHVLNTIFANPKTLKVFHAGTSDIEWLQEYTF